MKKTLLLILLTSLMTGAFAQDQGSPADRSIPVVYRDSILAFQSRYVTSHEVVKGSDRERIGFYPADDAYLVHASFTPLKNSRWFTMETSGSLKKTFRIFGTIRFSIHDTVQELQLLQGQYLGGDPFLTNYLFLPFTDATTGNGSYETGRYIDLMIGDIKAGKIDVDFNKCYNPYCAYVSGKYNCPIPPAANSLKVAILAGERKYRKD